MEVKTSSLGTLIDGKMWIGTFKKPGENFPYLIRTKTQVEIIPRSGQIYVSNEYNIYIMIHQPAVFSIVNPAALSHGCIRISKIQINSAENSC